jgi:hypothetical protein
VLERVTAAESFCRRRTGGGLQVGLELGTCLLEVCSSAFKKQQTRARDQLQRSRTQTSDESIESIDHQGRLVSSSTAVHVIANKWARLWHHGDKANRHKATAHLLAGSFASGRESVHRLKRSAVHSVLGTSFDRSSSGCNILCVLGQ